MKKIIIFVFSALILFTSCKKYLDVNTDPNNPGTVPYSTLFPSAITSSSMVYGGFLVTTGSLWAQHFTQSNSSNQYKGLDAYDITPSSHDNIFTEAFVNSLKNYDRIMKDAETASDWNVYLPATCMFAFVAQTLIDCWDKLPYSETLLGNDNRTPKWEEGSAIYADLIKRIDEALGKDFEAKTNTNLGTFDFVFGGNVENWKKFANTLKLKLYLRQTKVNPSVANAGITACLNDPIGFVNEAKVAVFTSASGKYNPFYGTNIASNGLGVHNHRASNTMVNFLNANSDTRKTAFYTAGTASSAGGQVIGLDQGDFNNTTPGTAHFATGKWGATEPVYFFSAPQVKFMLAEGKERIGQDGKADYDAGVLAAFTMRNLNGSAFVASGGAYEYPSAAADKIKAIITQKWVASCLISTCIESWFDHSRTGYPDFFTVSKNSVLSDNSALPKRFIYPLREVNNNPNTPKIEAVSVPVWWAK